MKKEMVVCDECESNLSNTQCRICGKELCRTHTNHINVSIYNPRSHWETTKVEASSLKIDCDLTHPNAKSIKVCSSCKGKFTNGLEAIKTGDLEFFLTKILEIVSECAKVEVL